mmetsp:Transcript_21656/g.33332  ORF Transcript_21656/g.33332 Transcript_21656/m.33332 type:complete len:172 (-) Transcript_21656:1150-1665(-)|eukprot:CAMPEP_0170482442 /NCGR_PEP_ID=MMETSP0208-20121228/2454_1 /TAXON_ID=197538 /ORGANISM="Strombidium inclinatum, Strain S3" /LENGTH=171 /DNA_ID=CAMNT_0010755281 /DNA_START=272 /DNA_END=787 /DNA_ORIENTATION=-
MTTVTFHYIGFFCILFRTERIFKVMRLERKYINEIYSLDKATSSPLLELNLEKAERKLKEHQEKKDREMIECREGHYLKLTSVIICGFTLFGMLAFMLPDYFFMLMPIFRSTASMKYLAVDRRDNFSLFLQYDSISPPKVVVNQLSFVICNYFEVLTIYVQWRRLKFAKEN